VPDWRSMTRSERRDYYDRRYDLPPAPAAPAVCRPDCSCSDCCRRAADRAVEIARSGRVYEYDSGAGRYVEVPQRRRLEWQEGE